MDLDNQQRDDIITAIKKVYKLTPAEDLHLDLSSFLVFSKGQEYRYLYTWQINNTFNKMYLCSIRNSYAVDVMNNYTFFETNHISGRYLVILIESKIELPDLIIRPSTMADKVSNLLLHFDIKLDNRPKFNAEYILESGATKPVCESLLTPELTSVIEKQKDFCLEIRESRILIKYQHEMQLEESMNLLAIGKLLDYIIKNKS